MSKLEAIVQMITARLGATTMTLQSLMHLEKKESTKCASSAWKQWIPYEGPPNHSTRVLRDRVQTNQVVIATPKVAKFDQ